MNYKELEEEGFNKHGNFFSNEDLSINLLSGTISFKDIDMMPLELNTKNIKLDDLLDIASLIKQIKSGRPSV